jgi:hypothetical protein
MMAGLLKAGRHIPSIQDMEGLTENGDYPIMRKREAQEQLFAHLMIKITQHDQK